MNKITIRGHLFLKRTCRFHFMTISGFWPWLFEGWTMLSTQEITIQQTARWIAIYLVDRVIQPSNIWNLVFSLPLTLNYQIPHTSLCSLFSYLLTQWPTTQAITHFQNELVVRVYQAWGWKTMEQKKKPDTMQFLFQYLLVPSMW